MKLWKVLTGLCLGLVLVVPAQASETFRIRANCATGDEAGIAVKPNQVTGDFATFVVTWKKNLLVIGELACLVDGEFFTFGSWIADSDGALVISAGTFGEACGLFLCTANGSDKVTAAAFFGAPDPTLGRASADARVPTRQLAPIRADDFPGVSERLGKLAAAAKKARRAGR